MPFVSSIRKQYDLPSEHPNNNFEVTGGDVVYTAGGYKIHMFTTAGDHTLNISYKGGDSSAMHLQKTGLDFEYLAIGGGAGGGSRHGGGGGAGGMVTSTNASLGAAGYPITVGNGGSGIQGDQRGNAGQNTVFNTVTANGGGGGGTWADGGNANPGGSGGGATNSNNLNIGITTQVENTPMNGEGFGNPGGSSTVWGNPIGHLREGGGGGAGGRGMDANEAEEVGRGNTGLGGPGRANSILGTNYFWAGGGGGAGWSEPGAPGGKGGAGGGSHGGQGGGSALNNGAAGVQPSGNLATVGGNGGNAGANTGSGGGGGQQVPSRGGDGAPGIVVVRYRI